VTSACFWIAGCGVLLPPAPSAADPPTCRYGDHHSSRAGHDHITTRLLQLSASLLTAVHTPPLQNAAARVIFNVGKQEHVSPYLEQLHWLPVRARDAVQIMCTLMHAIHNKRCPAYLADVVQLVGMASIANRSAFCGQQQLFSTTSEYQSRRARLFIRRSGCLEPTTREHPPAANYIFH